MTKKQQQIARNLAWRNALAEGRIVKVDGQLRSYNTVAEAESAAALFIEAECEGVAILKVSEAEQDATTARLTK